MTSLVPPRCQRGFLAFRKGLRQEAGLRWRVQDASKGHDTTIKRRENQWLGKMLHQLASGPSQARSSATLTQARPPRALQVRHWRSVRNTAKASKLGSLVADPCSHPMGRQNIDGLSLWVSQGIYCLFWLIVLRAAESGELPIAARGWARQGIGGRVIVPRDCRTRCAGHHTC